LRHKLAVAGKPRERVGFGDPGKRDRGALARDIAEGYVSPEAPKSDYGTTRS